MNMPKIAIAMGLLLDLVGIVGFTHAALNGIVAITALIPLFLGIIFVAFGIASLTSPPLRKHLMHGLAMLALLGALAGAGRLAMTWNKTTVTPVARGSQAAMAVICALTLFFCIKSFRDARRAREALPAA